MGTFIVGIIVLVVILFAIRATIKNRKEGGCGCGCDSCGCHCHDKK